MKIIPEQLTLLNLEFEDLSSSVLLISSCNSPFKFSFVDVKNASKSPSYCERTSWNFF